MLGDEGGCGEELCEAAEKDSGIRGGTPEMFCYEKGKSKDRKR
ncbi:MAG: hypothetical protein ACLRL6_01560 [Clostridium sp.]